MLLPTDQAFLKSMPPTPRCLDGLNKLLAGAHMLMSAYEEVSSLANHQAPQLRVFQETHKLIQAELAQLKGFHSETVATLQGSLESAQAELAKAREELNESHIREETLQKHQSILDRKNASLMDAVEEQMSRAERAEKALAESERQKEQLRTSFLESSEFKAAVEDRAYPFFKTGFKRCLQQFQEAELIPKDRANFPDFGLAIASLAGAGVGDNEGTSEEEEGEEPAEEEKQEKSVEGEEEEKPGEGEAEQIEKPTEEEKKPETSHVDIE
ncbi:uncharacterized protein [Primulina eburnea]|uniref:uncharacterized protein n=1 Tax=Primulina eburnea TaxID=1245227 RepID=UPI003C6C5555